MKKNPFQIEAILTGISTKADRGLSLRFATQEMSPEASHAAMGYCHEFGWLLFAPNELTEVDIPTCDAEDKKKTPSKRLRAVLFKLHLQEGGKPEEFDVFYRRKMETIIEHFKKVLE